eukprot:CAMPEP_0117587352 /NCGR_PEP_ID=MMETSP0784-20121206/69250_1 /TAXON_ID=39447 /ORGANISM="" /LENGTH=192 /DNA_ID=CAMNT_0005388595 /DNA_START=59 /DNA_END=634 /DNA_ORIENTATION=+
MWSGFEAFFGIGADTATPPSSRSAEGDKAMNAERAPLRPDPNISKNGPAIFCDRSTRRRSCGVCGISATDWCDDAEDVEPPLVVQMPHDAPRSEFDRTQPRATAVDFMARYEIVREEQQVVRMPMRVAIDLMREASFKPQAEQCQPIAPTEEPSSSSELVTRTWHPEGGEAIDRSEAPSLMSEQHASRREIG